MNKIPLLIHVGVDDWTPEMAIIASNLKWILNINQPFLT